MHFLDTYLAMATRFQCPALEKTWSPTFEMRWFKKKNRARISLRWPFSPYRYVFLHRFAGFRHSIIKQIWRGSRTLAQCPLSYVFIHDSLYRTYLPWRQHASWSKFTATLRKDSKTRTLFLSLGLNCWTQRNIEDMVSLGANLHGGVSRRWCLKLVFGLILLSFFLSFCAA